jgi:ectoine hydroxylase-related dioxygenase (phytanoyl-CoA dioxygenase family)
MIPFTDSADLLDDHDALRSRFERDGFVFLRGVVDTDVLFDLRRRLTAVCAEHRWWRAGTDPLDAVPDIEPRVEGEKLFFEVYDDIQKLEALHAVPHHQSVRRLMTALLGESAFPHPLSIARLSFPDNDDWSTPPHQDYPNNQGTEDLYACWIPLGDCPVRMGSLTLLRGSHRLGVLPLRFSLGAGHRRAVLDERSADLEWVGGDFRAGDAVVFHSLAVHRALPNRSDRMRLSVDYRFQREGEPLTEGCLEPHFGRLGWEEIYRNWERDDLQYYWRDKAYDLATWDPSFHELSEEESENYVLLWLRWRGRHPRADSPITKLNWERADEPTRERVDD